jgi:hypothetical protein
VTASSQAREAVETADPEKIHRLRRLLEIHDGAPVAYRALAITLVSGLAVSIAFAFAARTAGRAWLDVPGSLAPLKTRALLMTVAMPVLGNSFGFFMAYRKPSRRSPLLFLGPGVVMVSAAIGVSLLQLPAAASAQSIVATIVVNLVATAVIVALLLRLRSDPRAAYHGSE